MADIIKFPTVLRAAQADIALAASVGIQLVQLKRTLESWRQILHRLDQLAQPDDAGQLSEQSRHIRELMADAERAIAHFQACEGAASDGNRAPD
ncbi:MULTISPECIES: hypothetical protein [unclassified Bradyrhizobium]|uniref:hypothetical protein n=1 Tax=unclassified Bradyrhizobium TaxID=2631580 RepID=UPI0028E3A11E|nr:MULTISPECIES: hypothetical protein [unclassified Bradyrhizobium]